MTAVPAAAGYVVNRAWGICAWLVILALTVKCVNWKFWLADRIMLTFTFTGDLEDGPEGVVSGRGGGRNSPFGLTVCPHDREDTTIRAAANASMWKHSAEAWHGHALTFARERSSPRKRRNVHRSVLLGERDLA
nr:uncharacterized protein LOC112293825 [Physcomitrium patens]|eukprot:XP_024399471.1 uncharacterized protein LOC112293825 [Physcomitrella patens]